MPDTPEAPTTTFLRTTVQVDWTRPVSGGSELTGYKVSFLQSDLVTYSFELTDCDGGVQQILDSNTCTVQVASLRAAPFSLPWGSSVVVKVTATNSYGDSNESLPGNGAVIITYPDAPVGLSEVVALRTPSSISFVWSEGAQNGGTPVFEYRISMDSGSGFEILTTVTSLEHTETGLTFGQIYKFYVEAHNAFDYSVASETISILCAAEPEQPAQPTTSVSGDQVTFTWATPVENGTPITGYNVKIRKADLTYITDTTVCNGLAQNVITSTECVLPISKLTAAPFSLL